MEYERGRVVISLTGRDKGRYMAVLETEPGYAFVANGKLRRISQPKKKNIKHLAATNTVLEDKDLENDRALLRAIFETFGSFGR